MAVSSSESPAYWGSTSDCGALTVGRRRTGAISSSSSSEIVIGEWESVGSSSSEITIEQWGLGGRTGRTGATEVTEATEAVGVTEGSETVGVTEATDAAGMTEGTNAAGVAEATGARRTSGCTMVEGLTEVDALELSSSMKCV